MASAAKKAAHAGVSSADVESFAEYLKGCRRILALLGAGLSASSGLPTFRGAGGLWRTHDATELATPEAFQADPALVWQFYSFRRHMALKAAPNKAHYALAELSRRNKDFITISQNVDGLSQRALHPSEQLHLLHGSLFNVKCTSFFCRYTRKDDFTDPIAPSLAIPKKSSLVKTDEDQGETGTKQIEESDEEIDISDIGHHLPDIPVKDLPQCPECNGLLRPGVVWFGEPLPSKTLKTVDEWIESDPVDLMLVIGTSSSVYPAAGYTDIARAHGARIAVINMEQSVKTLGENDWFFQGDASVVVPEILKSVIGDI
ncbi:SIR2 family histone deacetylase [Penicillium argentinense]|uniref:NAD-dependent protein deacylase n=1 Tax=Penicillium argentinense TaxID=1131581 RepID=A0A9W9K1Z0_9EURO|nr:SIR2 family histone deacetylase [Penicillium argentinense]KAJ5090149.1 SIR2 family histone deacetylase [Penicillium argentinense]